MCFSFFSFLGFSFLFFSFKRQMFVGWGELPNYECFFCLRVSESWASNECPRDVSAQLVIFNYLFSGNRFSLMFFNGIMLLGTKLFIYQIATLHAVATLFNSCKNTFKKYAWAFFNAPSSLFSLVFFFVLRGRGREVNVER